MAGIATSTCPRGRPASLVTLPVIVTGSCAASRAGSARTALRMKGVNRRGVNCMSPPASDVTRTTSAACLAGRCCNNGLHVDEPRAHTTTMAGRAHSAATATAIAAFISPFTAAR